MSKKFAFLVHPRGDVAADMGRLWQPLGRLPEGMYDWALGTLPIPPITWGTVNEQGNDDPLGWIITIPVGAKQLLSARRRWSINKIEQAIDKAERLGAEIVGLGGLTAPVAGGGKLLRRRDNIAITNGNAFTAKLTADAITRLLRFTGLARPHVAFVGATGSVGACVVELTAGQGDIGEMTLVARSRDRLEMVAARARKRARGALVNVATDIAAARRADLVVLTTSAPDALLKSEHLKPGAVVLDDTQPRNTSPSLRDERPDVLVVDGGMAYLDGIDIRANIGDMPSGYAYACLCETVLLALHDHDGDFSIGHPSIEQAHYMQRLADRFSHLGFGLGDFLSFGERLDGLREAVADMEMAS